MDILERYLSRLKKAWEWTGCWLEEGREVINSDIQTVTADGTVHCTGGGRCFRGRWI